MNPNSNIPPDADTTPTLPILAGKKGLIVGIANDQSIAYGCAQVMHKLGATLAITYFNAKAEPYVRPLAEQLEADLILPLDVEQPGQLEAMVPSLQKMQFVRLPRFWSNSWPCLRSLSSAGESLTSCCTPSPLRQPPTCMAAS